MYTGLDEIREKVADTESMFEGTRIKKLSGFRVVGKGPTRKETTEVCFTEDMHSKIPRQLTPDA
jgi:hypothetical protein